MTGSARTERRRLAAILAADVVGYAGLIAADEAGTLSRLQALFREVVQPLTTAHGGRIFRLLGDAVFADFTSAVEALRGAIALQAAVAGRAAAEMDQPQLVLRVGIALGDVVVRGGDLYGDGVNVAARLEALAEPGGILVSAAVAEQAHGRVDCTLEDAGPLALKNIANPVQGFRVRTGALPAIPLCGTFKGPPSLVVMPFANLSGDPAKDYIAVGITEELTTALARVRWFHVVAHRSAAAHGSSHVDVRRIGRGFGARYVLEGSVRQAGRSIRIGCQLIEAETGRHVWAERFQGGSDDIFALQDRVAEDVAGAVEPSLERAEIERVRTKPAASMTAYDLYLRALPPFFTRTEEGCAEALALLRRATALDPGFGLAKAQTVACLVQRVERGWASPGDREEGVRLAYDVLGLSGSDPLPLVCVVYAFGLLAQNTAGALDVARRALKLNLNSALVQGAAGLAAAWACDPAASAAHFRRALDLSPCDPDAAYWIAGVARAELMADRAAAAVPLAERAIREMPGCVAAHRILIAALFCLGRHREAEAAVDRHRAATPGIARFSAETIRQMYRDQDFANMLVQAWRNAGLPE